MNCLKIHDGPRPMCVLSRTLTTAVFLPVAPRDWLGFFPQARVLVPRYALNHCPPSDGSMAMFTERPRDWSPAPQLSLVRLNICSRPVRHAQVPGKVTGSELCEAGKSSLHLGSTLSQSPRQNPGSSFLLPLLHCPYPDCDVSEVSLSSALPFHLHTTALSGSTSCLSSVPPIESPILSYFRVILHLVRPPPSSGEILIEPIGWFSHLTCHFGFLNEASFFKDALLTKLSTTSLVWKPLNEFLL